MSEVIYVETRNASILGPGLGHSRATSIHADVRGAQQVSVYARSAVKAEDIKRVIYFGGGTGEGNPGGSDTYAPLCEDTFGQTEHLWTSVPVYGPMIRVEVSCQQTATVVDITIYAVRDAQAYP